MQKTRRLLVIDNYDSFTYNLVQMFRKYDLEVLVSRSDQIDVKDVNKLRPTYIVISPGPKDPEHAGISKKIIRKFGESIPILGVCLGMQCINEVYSGHTVSAPVPIHGKTTIINHNGRGIFRKAKKRFKAALYHSLMIEVQSDDLKVTASSSDNVIMGIQHRDFPVHGVQFHPESFMTEEGEKLIDNFLKLR